MKEDYLIKDYLNKGLSAEERIQMERAISFTEKLDIPEGKSKDQAWNTILSKIDKVEEDNTRILRPAKKVNRKPWIWVAASAAILALSAYFNFISQDRLITKEALTGEQVTITLPDNSLVTLNADTQISYKKNGFTENRSVLLSGEAFFEVTQGSPFKIQDGKSEIKVLGTTFNVYSRSNSLKVSVFTGSVEVKSNNQTVVLNKGEEVNLVKGTLEKELFNPDKTGTWRKGSFYFDTTELSKVIDELERQFDIKFLVKADISQRFYSGFFNKNNLMEALQLVFVPMGLSFKTNENQVTIE